MSERIYNFQDILYLNYYTEEDSEHHLIVDNLAIDMTWEYSRENAPYDLSEAVEFCNRVDNVVYRGYKYNQDSYITFTTGVTFLNFTQTVQDAIDNKNGWTMKALAELFECEHRSRLNVSIAHAMSLFLCLNLLLLFKFTVMDFFLIVLMLLSLACILCVMA